jgi:hypothetical protein
MHRDVGLVALGLLLGIGLMAAVMMTAANDVKRTDDVLRGIRLKYGSRVQGQG